MTALFIEIKYEGESVNLYDTEKDEDDNGELRYTEKIQEEFDAVYDEVFQYLESNQIK